MTAPGLVLVAHGTRSAKGVQTIATLAEAVTTELDAGTTPLDVAAGATPWVRTAFVDVLGPSPAEVLRDVASPAGESAAAVVVPAFLASGYHVYQDVPRAVADSGHPAVAITPAMGPDTALARIMAMRLRAAGWSYGDAVVLAAAGSSDARARSDVRRAAALLAERLGAAVRIGYIATGAPRVPDVVAASRAAGASRVFIASYLLAHGLFQQRLHEAGADGVAEPIGVHPAVVRLIAERYQFAAREMASARAR
ncbi:sirohydrochlorin chelatase [Nocardia sp. CNY236]|uniref:sirohydrochlorin chelatase n=1 Tax=Nocardia sp. CNY236 TaxID=1169152 RepID=UPI0004242120|nr:CbiX/SirB N-terminal domain-containing protein [Nocardia sp. CNY236]